MSRKQRPKPGALDAKFGNEGVAGGAATMVRRVRRAVAGFWLRSSSISDGCQISYDASTASPLANRGAMTVHRSRLLIRSCRNPPSSVHSAESNLSRSIRKMWSASRPRRTTLRPASCRYS